MIDRWSTGRITFMNYFSSTFFYIKCICVVELCMELSAIVASQSALKCMWNSIRDPVESLCVTRTRALWFFMSLRLTISFDT
jgi:hypothetical protein